MEFRDGLRRHRRELLEAKVRVSWLGEAGGVNEVLCPCLDISESGLAVLSRHPVQRGSLVGVEIVGRGFRGSASVRSCVHVPKGYRLGLELVGSKLKSPTTAAGA